MVALEKLSSSLVLCAPLKFSSTIPRCRTISRCEFSIEFEFDFIIFFGCGIRVVCGRMSVYEFDPHRSNCVNTVHMCSAAIYPVQPQFMMTHN